LADEINRASPKTQSALLEAMAEGQVTVEGQTFKLPEPFFVIATQNPLEEWGTYPLPVSQLDRFTTKTSVGYPPPEVEKEILEGKNPYYRLEHISPLLSSEKILKIQKEVENVKIGLKELDFIVETLQRSRNHPDLSMGISTRGAMQWLNLAKAVAYIRELNIVPLEILKEVALITLPHRVVVKESSLKSAEEIIKEIIE